MTHQSFSELRFLDYSIAFAGHGRFTLLSLHVIDMKSNTQQEVIILLHCVEFPGRTFKGRQDIKVGVQKDDDVIDLVSGGAKAADFSFALRVEKSSKTGKPNFLGPFAHGTPTD